MSRFTNLALRFNTSHDELRICSQLNTFWFISSARTVSKSRHGSIYIRRSISSNGDMTPIVLSHLITPFLHSTGRGGGHHRNRHINIIITTEKNEHSDHLLRMLVHTLSSISLIVSQPCVNIYSYSFTVHASSSRLGLSLPLFICIWNQPGRSWPNLNL